MLVSLCSNYASQFGDDFEHYPDIGEWNGQLNGELQTKIA